MGDQQSSKTLKWGQIPSEGKTEEYWMKLTDDFFTEALRAAEKKPKSQARLVNQDVSGKAVNDFTKTPSDQEPVTIADSLETFQAFLTDVMQAAEKESRIQETLKDAKIKTDWPEDQMLEWITQTYERATGKTRQKILDEIRAREKANSSKNSD